MSRKKFLTGFVASAALAASGVSAQASTTATAAAANPCVSGLQGCVLPVRGEVAQVVEEASKSGFPILPILLGLGAVVGLLAQTGGDDEDEAPFSP